MSTADLVALIVGSLLPMLVAVVVRSSWPSWVKGAVAVISSGVAGTVTALATGELVDPKGWVQSIVIVFGASMVTYKAFWQPTGIGPAIERATQPSEPVVSKG